MQPSEKKNGSWFAAGDINAFFGLSLDNIAGLVLIVGLLRKVFDVDESFLLSHIVPGTAIGVLVGDFLFFLMAIRLGRRENRPSVTAMPLGLDTPSIFGMAFFVLGPAYLHAKNQLGMDSAQACQYMWEIGIGCVFFSGIFKVVCAFASNWARNTFPRAGLLGSLASVAIVIISFIPLLDVLSSPVVGMISLAVVLVALIGHVPLPGKIPGVIGALILGGAIHYIMLALGMLHSSPSAAVQLVPTEWTSVFGLSWTARLGEAANYLPAVLPLALATVIGGIDCTESAAAAGDSFPTGQVIGVEAIATLCAAFCGGVIQTTPYIGHPAYKAMGGRAAYTLATAIFIGVCGLLGLFGYFYQFIPPAAVYPILIFVGLEISSQSFLATPRRHYPAVAFACVPALAFLSMFFVGQIFGDAGISPMSLKEEELRTKLQVADMLKNGFIVTSLLWASALALSIDRRLYAAGGFFAIAGLFTLFGVIHSPLPNASFFLPNIPGLPLPWRLDEKLQPIVTQWAVGYLGAAGTLCLWGYYLRQIGVYGVSGRSDSEGA